MRSSVLIDRMPTSSTYGYGSTYRSSYGTSSGVSPVTHRRSPSTSRYSGDSNYLTKPSMGRQLPTGPGPLDARGNRLTDYSLGTSSFKSRGIRNSTYTKSTPLKADHTTYTSTASNYGTLGRKTSRVSDRDTGLSSTNSGRLSAGRRSSSLADLHISNNVDGVTGKDTYTSQSRPSDYSSSTYSPYVRDNRDILMGGRTQRPSLREKDTSYRPTRHISSVSRDASPSTEGNKPTSRKASIIDLHVETTPKSLSRQSSNSSFSTSSSKYESGGKVGLRNLGNTCFMNSVLQCLSNTKPLLLYCLNDNYHLDINSSSSSLKGGLIKAYVNLMQSMWKDRNESYISPNTFKSQIQRFAPRFMGYAQQDAQEFLRYLLEGLHEDVNHVIKKPKPIILDDDNLETKNDTEKAQEYWKAYLALDNSRIVEIFVGQLKSELKFSSCKHRSVTFDPFWDLSLPIPKGRSEVSLEDCLRLFMKEEELEDEERPNCTKCKSRRSCTKSFSIQKFPQILVLHLKRFSQERYGRKLSTMVEYPVNGLDLTEYASEKGTSRVLYNLYGVSFHSGGVHSGHYTAICKHPFTGDWHDFNDTRVSSARSNQAVSPEGYLLFYELSSQPSKL